MLSAAITVLFAVTGIIAVATVVHTLREARVVYDRLMREGEVMRAGLALQASATEMSLRPKAVTSPRRALAMPRPVMARNLALPSAVAA